MTKVHFDCKDSTKSTYDINCSEGQCSTDVWPTCEVPDEKSIKLIEGNESVTWKHVDCEEILIPYFNKSASCGKGGSKIGMLKSVVGTGVFNQEILVPCLYI